MVRSEVAISLEESILNRLDKLVKKKSFPIAARPSKKLLRKNSLASREVV